MDFYHRYLERRGVSSEQLQDLLTPYLVAAETRTPSPWRPEGMSMGAMVPVLELFAINAFEELEPLLESRRASCCSCGERRGTSAAGDHRGPGALSAARASVPAPRHTLLAHNEHWLAGDIGKRGRDRRHPEDGRVPVGSPTIVCCLPAVGMNTTARPRASAR